ncbi:hypothetical protein F5051DRAFT_304146, partial [Lentinula edodes]
SNNYRYIHPEKKSLIVSICCHGISQSELARQTGMGIRTIQRIMHNWRSGGDVVRKLKNPVSCSCSMNSVEIAFLEGLLEQTPDLYLYEIKERLEDVYGANYTESTISRTLEQCGWTRKKV